MIQKEPKDNHLTLKHQSETSCMKIGEIKNGYRILFPKTRREEKHLAKTEGRQQMCLNVGGI